MHSLSRMLEISFVLRFVLNFTITFLIVFNLVTLVLSVEVRVCAVYEKPWIMQLSVFVMNCKQLLMSC